jgi:hypothetical protein
MRKMYGLVMFFLISQVALGQSFEIIYAQDVIRGTIGETIKTPLRIKNLTDKPIYLVVRRLDQQLGSTQKASFCVDQVCQENRSKDFTLKIDPFSTSESIQISLEAGLAAVMSSIKYSITNKNNPTEATDLDFTFLVEENRSKENLYSSRFIRLYNVYPNPVIDFANVDYKILAPSIKARIVLHNILGNRMDEYPLPASETQIKISVAAMAAGIYFYTLYVENEGVVTRKLVVRK